MIIEIKVPTPGESITQVLLSKWLVKEGDFVGQVCMDNVKEYLEEGVLRGIAPNAKSTIDKKGHDFPDIDTGELMNHLVYIYVKGHSSGASLVVR